MPDTTVSAAAETLRLIAADAPLEEVLQGLEGLGDGISKRELKALREAATQLHHARKVDRQRLRGMIVLDASAADLAGLLDLDDALAAVCRRSRSLLGTDVAYITLIDSVRGDTYVNATDGITSEAFRQMRLPLGTGLGGLVARDGVPVATSDYAADNRFAHSKDIDDRVVAEGLRAIAGVPLRRRGKVIGVLLSGSRSVRQFEPRELALFEALATHAAIAIENARLFEAAEASYAKLELADARSRAAASLHARLATLAVEGAGADELYAAVRDAVEGRLELIESDESAGPPPAAGDRQVAIEVAVGAELLGHLLWTPDRGADTERGSELLRRSAPIIAGQLLRQRARTDAQYRRRAELIRSIFEDEAADPEHLSQEAAGLGVDLESSHVVLVAEPPRELERWASLTAARAAVDAGAASREAGGRITVLVPGADVHAAGERWSEILGSGSGLTPSIGVGRPASGVPELRAAHQEAAATLNLLRALGRTGTTAYASDLGLFAMVFARGEPGMVSRFVNSVLGGLLERDRARGRPVLIPTLEAYFENGGQLSATARGLDVHINTVYQRIARLDELLGADWRAPDRLMEIQFALRARSLFESMQEDARP